MILRRTPKFDDSSKLLWFYSLTSTVLKAVKVIENVKYSISSFAVRILYLQKRGISSEIKNVIVHRVFSRRIRAKLITQDAKS